MNESDHFKETWDYELWGYEFLQAMESSLLVENILNINIFHSTK